jgi:hypothetical protein
MSSIVISGDTSGQVTLAAPAVAGTTTITMPAVTGTMTVLSATQSMVRLNTSNGFGSTNTVIRRFTTTVTNQGSDITYADSATLGNTFTINTTGVYAISYTDASASAGSTPFGISLNSTQLTTTISDITAADRLAYVDTVSANGSATISWTGYLTSGSVIRAHGTVSTAPSVPARVQFTIVRVT